MTPQEQEAFDKGRLQGLKEMDEAVNPGEWKKRVYGEGRQEKLDRLRQEYSGK